MGVLLRWELLYKALQLLDYLLCVVFNASRHLLHPRGTAAPRDSSRSDPRRFRPFRTFSRPVPGAQGASRTLPGCRLRLTGPPSRATRDEGGAKRRNGFSDLDSDRWLSET